MNKRGAIPVFVILLIVLGVVGLFVGGIFGSKASSLLNSIPPPIWIVLIGIAILRLLFGGKK